MSEDGSTYRGKIPWHMVQKRRQREKAMALYAAGGMDDTTTDEEEEEEEKEEEEEEEQQEEEEDPVEQEERCKKKLGEATALIHEQNDEICGLQGQIDQLHAQADRSRAEAIRVGRLAFHRQAAIRARDQQILELAEALEQRRRNCRCQGQGPRIRRQPCLPAAQPAVRPPRRARTPPAPMQRRIGRVAKNGVRRPYPK